MATNPDKTPSAITRRPATEALSGATLAGSASLVQPFRKDAQRAQVRHIDHSPRLLTQRQTLHALAQAPAISAQGAHIGALFGHPVTPVTGEPVLQRKITVAGRQYGMQDGTLGELELAIDREMDQIEKTLRPSGVSVDQVLTRFDFSDRHFENFAELIKAVRRELKADLGADDPGVDRLLTVHPLEHDRREGFSPVLAKLQTLDPSGNIRNLVLEDTEAAQLVMAEYRKNSEHPESDTVLFKSILATLELHRAGATSRGERSGDEDQLLAYVNAAYDEDQVAKMVEDYGLTEQEHRAVVAYSYPNKSKLFVGDKWNLHYMGSSRGNWGPYGDGWKALSAALKKLPSLGRLQLELTTYRASRNSAESDALAQLPLGSQIVHGKHILSQGQQHVTSTALTFNYFNNPSRVEKAKGLMAVHGSSGVLINPFGGQGFVDGAEVLYPPNVITTLRAKLQGAYQRPGFSAPVYHLHETKPDPQRAIVDDFKFQQVANEYAEGYARQSETLTALIDQIQQFSAILTGGGERAISPDEKTVHHLSDLKQSLLDKIEAYQAHPKVIENYNKLVLIDQLKALKPIKQIELKILLLGQSPWAQSVARLEWLLHELS